MKGEEFLNRLYKDLNLSDEVIHTSYGIKNKDEAVKRYMDRLERVHNKAINNHKLELLKSMYYKKYIIKESDIPENFDSKKIIQSQKYSIDKWLNYLLDENTKYPMWVKYWVFQGMLKIGTYNEATGTYQKRSNKTLAPFIDINPEVLSRCISLIMDYVNNGNIDDIALDKLIESGNFQKLYTVLLSKTKEDLGINSDKRDGVWIKYYYETEEEAYEKEKRGVIPEYLRLYNSLQGYNTGWCTAGSKDLAKDQICGIDEYDGGDFLVYYTKDKNGEYKIPRIAIRMDYYGSIEEIRGIIDGQNIEEGLEDIIEKKLKSMKLKEKQIKDYLKKINDSKKLTILVKKQKNNIEFSIDDLSFLYEIDGDIIGFGWDADVRIEQLKSNRNSKDDIKKLLDTCKNDSEKINMILKNPILFKSIPFDYPNYNKLALGIAKKNGTIIMYVTREIENYFDIAIASVKNLSYVIQYIAEDTDNYEKIALEAVKNHPESLRFISTNIDQYVEIALVALRKSPNQLRYVPKNIDCYKQIVLEIIKQDYSNIEYIPDELKLDKDILIEVVKQDSKYFYKIPNNVEGYGEIAISAIKNDIFGDSYLLSKVPTDREDYPLVALEAVKKCGFALEYVPVDTKDYDKIALEAIKENAFAIQFVPCNITNYYSLALFSINMSPRAIEVIPYEYEEYSKLEEYVRKKYSGRAK